MSHIEHGVFLDIFGAGVLIKGASGVGKSEVALSLINRGHRLIADDTTEFQLTKAGEIVGCCPATLQDFLEVRGLGILNIRHLYGDVAVESHKPLHLVVNLVPAKDASMQNMDRLHGMHDVFQVLDTDIPRVSIPVAAGRSLDVLVEIAVRDQMLRNRGYVAAEELIERQQKCLEQADASHPN